MVRVRTISLKVSLADMMILDLGSVCDGEMSSVAEKQGQHRCVVV
jgi:hypothetical protein